MQVGYGVSILCPVYIGLGRSLLNTLQWVSNKRRIKPKPLTVLHDWTPTYLSLSSHIPSQVSPEHMQLLPPSALYISSSPSASVRLSVPIFFTVGPSSVGSWLKSQASKRPSLQPPKHLSLFNSFLHTIHFYLKLSYLLVRLLSVSTTRMEIPWGKRPWLPRSLLMILYLTHRKGSINTCGMKDKRLTEPSIDQESGTLCSHSNLLLIHYVPWSSPVLIEFWVFIC